MSRMNACAKQVIDFTVAASGIFLLLPLALIIALAIKADSPGPVFFSQMRLGRYGRPFRLYKFRKFRCDLVENGPSITSRGDSRMTRVGNFLQKSKLDELPQLWNVCRGDMSLVGPRPETYDFADCFDNGLQHVLDYKPGIFGPNQILFRNEDELFARVNHPERFYREVLFGCKARVDIAYFSQANIFTDIAWMMRGVLVVLFPALAGDIGDQGHPLVERWIREHEATAFRGSAIDTSKRPLVA